MRPRIASPCTESCGCQLCVSSFTRFFCWFLLLFNHFQGNVTGKVQAQGSMTLSSLYLLTIPCAWYPVCCAQARGVTGKVQFVNQAQGDITFLLPATASTQLHAGSSANTATYTVALYTADVRNAGTTGQVRLCVWSQC